MMRKLAIIMAMAMVLCGAFAMSAQADLLLDFSIPTPDTLSTNISLSGAGLSTIGNIPVDKVTGLITPNGAPPLAITDGNLAFSTGVMTSSNGEIYFAPGGFITITGEIVQGHGVETLLSGTFVGTPEIDKAANGVTGTFNASFIDSKDEELLHYFGVSYAQEGSPELIPGFSGLINLQITGFNTGELASLSGDVSNVPVPPSALLLGSGLLGLVGFRFRKNRA